MNKDALQRTTVLERKHTPPDPYTSDHTVTTHAELIDVFDLATHFHVHYRTAQRWTKTRQIPHYRIGKSVRYNLQEVLHAAASSTR